MKKLIFVVAILLVLSLNIHSVKANDSITPNILSPLFFTGVTNVIYHPFSKSSTLFTPLLNITSKMNRTPPLLA
jgi:hypothetical protein